MNPFAVRAVLVSLLLQAAMARADAPCATTIDEKSVGPATELAREAREAMAAGKFEKAQHLYEQAYCLLPEPILKHGLSSAELNLGRCEAAVRDARFWTERADRKDAGEALEWRDTVLKLCAEIIVLSTPAGAAVFIDGAAQPVGNAPWHGWLKSGQHTVVGRLPGLVDASSELLVPEERNPPLTVTLSLQAAGAPGVATPEARRAKAVQLGREAAEAYKAGSYAEAFAEYEAAYKLVPAPPLVLNLSRTALKLGRCEEAEGYALTYSAAFGGSDTAAIASPTTLLTSVHEQCPEMQITSDPPGAKLLIEGVARSSSFVTPWRGRLFVGKHAVRARLDGFPEQRVELDVIPGTPSQLRLTFVSTPVAAQVATPPPPPASVAPPPEPAPHPAPQVDLAATRSAPAPLRLRWEPFIPAGVAVVGLVVAITEGAWSRECPTTAETPGDVQREELCQLSHGTAADVSWAIAGAGAVTAGVLWLVLRPTSQSSTESAPSSSPHVSVTGNGVALSGRF
jgi:tetratricopeptide (TPR) repeat protein